MMRSRVPNGEKQTDKRTNAGERRLSGQLEFGEEEGATAFRRAWEQCLHLLATKVPVVTFETYIRPLEPVRLENNVAILGVASSYAREHLEKKSANAIRSALEFHLDISGLEVQFVVLTKEQQHRATTRRKPADGAKADAAQTALPLDSEAETADPSAIQNPKSKIQNWEDPAPGAQHPNLMRKNQAKKPEELPPVPSLNLTDRYQFDTFLVGRSNRLAHAGASHVAAKPGEVYNPLFLYGGPGLGKTHLMQAIANTLRQTQPKLRVAYVSGEYFTQRFVTAIAKHTTEDFRREYRHIDVWLMDDIQFIAGKNQTNEEFFHTFNTLYQMGKQIVLASDRSPRELNTMDERLRSRFQSGLIADIGAPDLETRLAILQKRCVSENVPIDDDVLLYIASAIQSNIRALEGAFTKLLAYSSIMSNAISLQLAQTVLSEYFIEKPIRQRKTNVQEVVEAVAEQFALPPEDILGAGRNKEIALARHVAFYIARELMPEMNLAHIGAAFGGRDHATVVYACAKVKTLMDVDTDLKALIGQLKRRLSS